LGVGHDGPKPVLPEVGVEAVPIGTDERVASRWIRCVRLRFGQDSLLRSPSVEDHSIELVVEIGDLLVQLVNGVDFASELFDRVNLGDEICDRRIEFLLPICGLDLLVLDWLQTRAQGLNTGLKFGETAVESVEALVDLLHFVEEEFGGGIHGTVELFLVTGKMGIQGIQTESKHKSIELDKGDRPR
jgi:hypothetical protein